MLPDLQTHSARIASGLPFVIFLPVTGKPDGNDEVDASPHVSL